MKFDLRHGDCLDIVPTLPAGSVDAIITDPPYGISYQSARRTDITKRKPKIQNDEKPFIWFLHSSFKTIKEGGAILVFCEWRFADIFKIAIDCAGFTIKSQIVWDRQWHGMGDLNSSFAPAHDLAWFAVKGGGFSFKNGRPKSVLSYQRIQADKLLHPTEKPVELMEYLCNKLSIQNETILDPFMGSGTTGVACVNTGRNFIGIEKDAEYFQIAQKRIEEARKDA